LAVLAIAAILSCSRSTPRTERRTEPVWVYGTLIPGIAEPPGPAEIIWSVPHSSLTVSNVTRDRYPQTWEWRFDADHEPVRLDARRRKDLSSAFRTIAGAEYRWEISGPVHPYPGNQVVDLFSNGSRVATFPMFPRWGPYGHDYLGYPRLYGVRASQGGRFLYVEGEFQYDGPVRTFTVVEVPNGRRRGDLADWSVCVASSADFASNTCQTTLLLNAAEDRVASKDCFLPARHRCGARLGYIGPGCSVAPCRSRVLIGDTSTGAVVHRIESWSYPQEAIAWSPDGAKLATGSPLAVFDSRTGIETGLQGVARAIAWIDDENLVTVEKDTFGLDVWSLASRQRVRTIPLPLAPSGISAAPNRIVGAVCGEVLRFVRLDDQAALTLRVVAPGDESLAIWFTDGGVYDDDSATQGDIAGEFAPGVFASRRLSGLWARFWTGRSLLPDEAGPLPPRATNRETDPRFKEVPCDPDHRGHLCQLLSFRCPDGCVMEGMTCRCGK
jgi:hypothetical protein